MFFCYSLFKIIEIFINEVILHEIMTYDKLAESITLYHLTMSYF